MKSNENPNNGNINNEISCFLDKTTIRKLAGAPNDDFISDPLNVILGYLECL